MNWPGAAARRSSMRGAPSLDQLGVLDHHHRVGAARHHAAGGDGGGGAGRDLDRRRMAAGDHLGVELEALSALSSLAPTVSAARSAKPSTLERSNGGTSIGATTSAPARGRARRASGTRLGGERREIEMLLEARARLLGRHHFEELLLPRGGAHAREQIGVAFGRALRVRSLYVAHGHGLTCTVAPAG